MDRSRDNLAITSNGFKNWKDASISFKPHEASASHEEALQVVMVLRKVFMASPILKSFLRPCLVTDASRCTLDRLAEPSDIDWQSTDGP